jgi:hypothetical protein
VAKIPLLVAGLLMVANAERAAAMVLLTTVELELIDPASSFLLTELPTFLLFLAFGLMVIGWIASIRASKRRSVFIQMIRRSTIVMGIVMVITFGLLAVLYYTLPGDSTENSVCGITDESTTGESKIQSIVSIVYYTLTAFCALLLSLGFMYYGGKILRLLRKRDGLRRSERVWFVTLFCSFSLFANSVVLLVMSAIGAWNSYDTNYLIGMGVLVLLETIPSFTIVFTYMDIPWRFLSASTSMSEESTKKTASTRRSIDLSAISVDQIY